MDSSFNSNIVSIYIDDFYYLLKTFKEIDEDKILKQAKEIAETNHDFPQTIPGILKEMFLNLSKEKLGEITTNSIIDFIKYIKQELANK